MVHDRMVRGRCSIAPQGRRLRAQAVALPGGGYGDVGELPAPAARFRETSRVLVLPLRPGDGVHCAGQAAEARAGCAHLLGRGAGFWRPLPARPYRPALIRLIAIAAAPARKPSRTNLLKEGNVMSISEPPEPVTPIALRKARRRALRLVRPEPAPRDANAAIGEPRAKGAVADLESHVRSDWWHEIFDALYLKTDGDVFENAANTVADADAVIAAAALSPAHRVPDLCCGQGRHTIELARRGFRSVTGVDLSHYLIDLARQRARTAAPAVNCLEAARRTGDFRGRTFECITRLANA